MDRPKGAKNLTPAELTFVNAVEAALRKGAITDNLVNLTCRHLTSDNPKAAVSMLLRILDMKYGKPVQPIAGKEGSEPIHVLVEHIAAKNTSSA